MWITIARILCTVAGFGVAAALAAPGVAAPTAKGDAGAWAELVAAYAN
jgi:hypothetical protein